MALNRINWTPKEQLFDYHVLTWKTSHLHPKTKVGVSGGVELRERAGGAAASTPESAQPEGIVPGYGRRDSRYRSGGLGRDGMAQDGDRVAVSVYQSGRQGSGQMQEAAAVAMPCADAQTQAAMQTAVLHNHNIEDAAHTFSAGRTVRKAGGRMKEIIVRLRDMYRRKQEKAARLVKGNRAAQQQKERQGTRRVSREEVLAMQGENHYLLDSYDKNGQYSTLGKGKY